MKKRKNSRAKGNRFERLIAKDFTDWCGFLCTRTPLSGGWAKTGDITPRDPKHMVDFIFSPELKNVEGWDFSSAFFCTPVGPTIKKWWRQCDTDAALSKKIPILIFTKSYDHIYCMITESLFDLIGLEEVTKKFLIIPNFRIVLWDDFKKIPYQEITKRVGGANDVSAR